MDRISFCKKCGKDFAWRRKICPHCGQHEDQEIVPDGVNCYFSAVAGESFDNPNGTSRQKILSRCASGEAIELVHERGNRHDRWAVQVLRKSGEQIGYLPREQSKDFVARMQRGDVYVAGLVEVTGGTREKPSRGAVLYILEAPAGCDRAQVQTYWTVVFGGALQRRSSS